MNLRRTCRAPSCSRGMPAKWRFPFVRQSASAIVVGGLTVTRLSSQRPCSPGFRVGWRSASRRAPRRRQRQDSMPRARHTVALIDRGARRQALGKAGVFSRNDRKVLPEPSKDRTEPTWSGAARLGCLGPRGRRLIIGCHIMARELAAFASPGAPFAGMR